MNYKTIETSAEVYAVIMGRHHKNLAVFSSASYPEGFFNSKNCYLFTAWGFKGADCPIMEAKTTWEGLDERGRRINEQTKCWLCLPLEDHE